MAKKNEVIKVKAEVENPVNLADKTAVDQLVDRILAHVDDSRKYILDATKHMTIIKRACGEEILRFMNPECAKAKPMSKMSFDERAAFCDMAGRLPDNTADEISNKLSAYSITAGIMSRKYLFESIRLARTYSDKDIIKAVDEYGANMTILTTLTGAAVESERWEVLKRAKDENKLTVKAFNSLMLEMRPDIKMTPEAAKAVQAQEVRKERATPTKVRGQVHEMDLENEGKQKGRRAEKDSLFKNTRSLASQFSKMQTHLEDHVLAQMADIWTAVADDLPALDQSEVKVIKDTGAALRSLMPQIIDLRKMCDNIILADAEYWIGRGEKPSTSSKDLNSDDVVKLINTIRAPDVGKKAKK